MKIISHEMNGLSAISSLHWVPYGHGFATYFGFKRKMFFCNLKSKFLLKLKIKYQRFKAKYRPSDITLLTPVNCRQTITLSGAINRVIIYICYRGALNLCYPAN
jgi:hypothetical protein